MFALHRGVVFYVMKNGLDPLEFTGGGTLFELVAELSHLPQFRPTIIAGW